MPKFRAFILWVYVGLGWEQKEVDGNNGNLMRTKGFWWVVVDENKRKLMGTK